MRKNSQDFSMQEALRLAQTPAGQQLLALLKASSSQTVQQAASAASAGNYQQAGQDLRQLLSDPEVQRLLQQLRR